MQKSWTPHSQPLSTHPRSFSHKLVPSSQHHAGVSSAPPPTTFHTTAHHCPTMPLMLSPPSPRCCCPPWTWFPQPPMLLSAADNGAHPPPKPRLRSPINTSPATPSQQDTPYSTLITRISPLFKFQPVSTFQQKARDECCKLKTTEENIKQKPEYIVRSKKLILSRCA
jgi:hypothetical protein